MDVVADFEVGVDMIGVEVVDSARLSIIETETGALIRGPGGRMLLDGVSVDDIAAADILDLDTLV